MNTLNVAGLATIQKTGETLRILANPATKKVRKSNLGSNLFEKEREVKLHNLKMGEVAM